MSHSMNPLRSNELIWRLIGRLAFNRIEVVDRQRIPESGPVLFVATHRNGALDGAAYMVAAPAAVPMVSAQLHRIPFGRYLFRGIPVARAKDRQRGIMASNTDATLHCMELLQHGGQLFIMPEGTSTLGPAHLPFQRGAARILQAVLAAGVRPAVVALGVHYEDPTVWQSRAEVLVGEPFYPSADDDVNVLHQAISKALEAVGANFPNAEAQQTAERLAYASTLGTSASYARSLKQFERAMPEALAAGVRDLDAIASREQLCLHQGVPLIPLASWVLYALYWLVLAPVVVGFALLNLPVLIGGYIASRKLPDEPNVIAFWRMIAALPLGVLWGTGMTVVLWLSCGGLAVLGYGLWTTGGIAAWYRFRKLSVALCNGLFHSRARASLLRAYDNLLELMSNEKTV